MSFDRTTAPVVRPIVLDWDSQLLGQVGDGFSRDLVPMAGKATLVLEKLQQHGKTESVMSSPVMLH
jgi:hypothetical protein